MNKWYNILLVSIAILFIGLTIGFFIGRSNTKVETKIERVVSYTRGDTITKFVTNPLPYAVHDTITKTIPIYTDTQSLYNVWRDYYKSRDYALDFSNDTIGDFKVKTTVSENRLVSAVSTINPIIRTVSEKETIIRVPTLQFYTLIGTSMDMKTNQMTIGADLKQKYMFGLSGIRFNDKVGYTINIGLKF